MSRKFKEDRSADDCGDEGYSKPSWATASNILAVGGIGLFFTHALLSYGVHPVLVIIAGASVCWVVDSLHFMVIEKPLINAWLKDHMERYHKKP